MVTSPEEKVPQSTLQRGKACLRCRKRKMRCDGVKPACQQCGRAKKADSCEYDDGRGKTRTQLLREEIARLQDRVRELEGSDQGRTSVTLHDPHAVRSTAGSPYTSEGSASPSTFAQDTKDSPNLSRSNLPSTSSSSPAPGFSGSPFFPDPRVQVALTPEISNFLLATFAPHKEQSGYLASLDKLRERMNLTSELQPHPALMGAIYLWACFVSRPIPFSRHEEQYLAYALDHLRAGLDSRDRILDLIQASCMLSLYYLANGRLDQGGYHANSASGLALQYRVHAVPVESKEIYDLRLMKGEVSASQRILAFWQVYNLDHCWSVVLQKPSMVPNGHKVACPWPLSEYDLDSIQEAVGFRTVGPFLDGEMLSVSFTIQTLRAKATALFARADHLASSWFPVHNSLKPSNTFREEVQTLEHSIAQYLLSLVPVQQLSTTQSEDRYIYFTTHILTHASVLRLYGRFASEDSVAFSKCSHAARAVVSIIRHIADQDLMFLDPIVVPCWSYAADALIRELDALEKPWSLSDPTTTRNDLRTVLFALKKVRAQFPLAGLTIPTIQKRLGEPLV
ncbi:hypothetical protein BDN72DRAFT_789479 [Pluteus cervinus]|uniref:Uncharacterized protein n=1 Tax=Pluteus cervinus TaxID=181527 RepID=A0ACD3B9E5_9AGAR|nr:hypothetical protein BDN72DRAFT_789479 [Pluteus cervinus]